MEPLRNLFKDEVRKVGLELGLPDYLVFRQPFPGPGLGIRIIGEVTAEKVRIVQDADWIYRSEVEKAAKEYKEAHGDIAARNMLVEHNLRLVAHIIKKYYGTQSEQDDLVSIGTIGLIKAINTFDMNKNIKLSSYASRCIENEILMHFRNAKKSAQDISLNETIDTFCGKYFHAAVDYVFVQFEVWNTET